MRHKWTQEDIEQLRELTAAGVPAEEIARRLGRTVDAVRVYAKRHGIRRVGGNSLWSPEEESAFAEDWRNGDMTRWTLQGKYRRSWSALKQRAQKLRLGPRPVSDLYITKGELMEAMGVTDSRVQSWIKQGLPVHRSRTNRTFGPMFDVDELLLFLERHQDEFDGRLVDEDFFYTMPAWLREKCRADYTGDTWNRKKPWTAEEDGRLRHLFRSGLTDRELGRQLGRTAPAIRARRFILGLPRRKTTRNGAGPVADRPDHEVK